MRKVITILVVDADEAFRESIANLLLSCGVEKLETAASIEAALEKASMNFDVILVDLFMPQMAGLQLAREFRKWMPKAKIILLVEDQLQAVINNKVKNKLNFPTILKSFVRRDLPRLLSEELN